MGIPRNATLAETIYRDIEKNDYLNQLYADLLYNYSLRLFSLALDEREIDIPSALRFAAVATGLSSVVIPHFFISISSL